MVRIRAFEEAGLAAQKRGLVLGAIHPSIGQEAVAAGVCAQLRTEDVLLSTHRGHGHTLAKGADPTAMMCELFGRAGRHLRRQGRLDAHRRFRGRHARRQRRGRGQHPDRRRRRPCDPVAWRGPDRLLHLRRWCDQPRAVPRGPELGADLRSAGPVRVRGQRLCRHHPHRGPDRRAGAACAGGEPGHPRARGRRQRSCWRSTRRAPSCSAGCVPARGRSSSGPRPTAWPATPPPIRPPTEPPRRSRPAGSATRSPLTRALLLAGGVAASELDAAEAEERAAIEAAVAAAEAAPWPDAAEAFTDVQDVGGWRATGHG